MAHPEDAIDDGRLDIQLGSQIVRCLRCEDALCDCIHAGCDVCQLFAFPQAQADSAIPAQVACTSDRQYMSDHLRARQCSLRMYTAAALPEQHTARRPACRSVCRPATRRSGPGGFMANAAQQASLGQHMIRALTCRRCNCSAL